MPANLTTNNISTTYQGLLHFNAALPATGFSKVYDGIGNETGISLSRDGIYTFDINARAFQTRDGETGAPHLSMSFSQINADDSILLNSRRSDNTTDNFLNVIIRDGKEAEIARFRGSDKALLVKGDIVAFHTSDKNLKDNIKNIENPLEKISKINGVTFNWNSSQDTHTGADIGVIAQEIEDIIPEAVTTRDTGYKAVKYEKIIPLLIESIKVLKERNETLEAKLATITL